MKCIKLIGALLAIGSVFTLNATPIVGKAALQTLQQTIIKNHPELTQQINKNQAKLHLFANTFRYGSLYKEGRVIVRLKAGVLPETFINGMGIASASKTKTFRLNDPIKKTSVAASRHIVVLESSTLTTKQFIAQLKNNASVDLVEPDYYLYTQSTTPNDSLFPELWGMNNTGQTGGTANADINAPEAWDRITGNSSVTVGIIDTGIDYHHADLINNVWRNLKELKGTAGVDDDGNGYIDDLYGIDTFNDDSDPLDDNSHGTHVAGTIGGVGNNTEGVTGVAWNVKMAACKFLNASGNGDTSDAIECINYFNGLKAQGENIVATNNSWGGGDFSQLLKDAIDASGTAGILFIAAAGNDGNNNDLTPSYPASYASSNIIAVAATDDTDIIADFSNYGATSVDLAAPGVSIVSSVLTTSGCPAFNPESAAVFHDGFEAGLGQWSLLGYLGSNPIYNNPSYWWQQNNAVSHSGISSASDSLSGNYTDSSVSSMTKGLNLSAVSTSLCGGFWLKGQIEYGYDDLYVYLSKDGGATWTQTISATGTFSDWTKVTFTIPDDFKTTGFLLSIVRANDSLVNYAGYEVDNVGIGGGTQDSYISNYDWYDGTSMATPHVSGAVALAAMAFPSETVAARKTRVLNNVDTLASLSGLVATSGRLNVSKMVVNGTDNLLRWPDYNNDAKADILWRHSLTGSNATWLMNGSSVISSNGITPVTDLNWRIGGTPDMNGDGKADILWRSYSSGNNLVWFVSGTTVIGSISVEALADLNWRIVGTPDMNGDGKPDILWRNYATGNNMVWFMNGSVHISTSSILSVVDTNWRIVGTPDMNNDGKPDILWRNYTSGSNYLWLMNGITRIDASTISPVLDLNWRIVGTPDMNRDGKPDILWRNYSSGSNLIWFMNGVSIIGNQGISGLSDVNWRIVNNGDF